MINLNFLQKYVNYSFNFHMKIFYHLVILFILFIVMKRPKAKKMFFNVI